MTSPTPHRPQQTPGTQQSAQAPESAEVPQQAQAPQTPQEPAPYEETRIERAIGRGFGRVTSRALAPYQTAVIRIGFSATWLLFLLREWPHRAVLYGPDSPWSLDMARRLLDGNHAFSVLPWSDSRGWFECVYLVAIVASALLMLGWRTRTMSVLFMVGVISLQNRSVFIGDGGDNVIHLMSMYLVLTRCGQVWSLDARRAKRAAAAASASGGDESGGIPTASRDLPGVILWAVLGLGLAVAQLSGNYGLDWSERRPGPAHRLEPGAVGPVGDARPVVGGAAVRARRAAHRSGHPRQARAQRRTAGDHGRGLPDLRHGRLVQDPGLALAGRHRGLLPDAPGLLLPLAGAVRAAGQQRGDRHADHLRDGDRAGRLPVHALQPPAEERAAGRDDLRAPLDRVPARAAVLLARDDRR